MTTVRDLLHDGDPIRYEPLTDLQRNRLRQAVISAAPAVAVSPLPWRTRGPAFVASLALIILTVAAIGWRLWSDGTTVLAAVRFEVRLAEDHAGPGLREVRVPGSDRVLYMHEEAVVTNDDIAGTRLSSNDRGRYDIGVQFTPAGARKMLAATAAHVGRPIVVLIDGAVVMAPVLRDAVSTSAVITGDYSRAQAERLMQGMSVRPAIEPRPR